MPTPRALDVGVTTVSASVTFAARAGVAVFATGGIGGVHRDAAQSPVISLTISSRSPVIRVVTVSAGAKAFLDLGRTLEEFETLGVPVVGWNTDRFPAFYTRDSGSPVTMTVRTGERRLRRWWLGECVNSATPGVCWSPTRSPRLTNSIPHRINTAIAAALADAEAPGCPGPGVTPVVLAAIAAATDGDSVPANLALAENNAASVAAEIAVAVASR
jgi:pseudouridine-5'-phosphate glycosidase